ncbi:MAG: hypothetical protein JXR37_02765 [Kiritimatiellae bacterium]|nr:hypothetical protein [Kiritimatiellia bacterium]
MAQGRIQRILLAFGCLVIATAVWLPCLHLFFREKSETHHSSDGIPPKARALAARHLAMWLAPDQRERELAKMRAHSAEWDFMGRTFLVLALSNMAIRDPAGKDDYLEIMDRIIDHTIRTESEQGIYHFLLPYARSGPWVADPPRSLFQDGEIALMIAVRRVVEEKAAYKPLMKERVDIMRAQMEQGPVLCGESYPDECWMFCNSVALATMRIAQVLDGADHSEFLRRWVETAKEKLVHKESGLLISSFDMAGRPIDGPEGSTIWFVAHCLQLVDDAFAEDQYRRAKAELANTVLGFGYAKEWPQSWTAPADIDSGPIIPIVEISAGSSGNAFIAAAAFRDLAYLGALHTSLNFGGLPIREGASLRYGASNQVGDAVLLYSTVLGPVWEKVLAGGHADRGTGGLEDRRNGST